MGQANSSQNLSKKPQASLSANTKPLPTQEAAMSKKNSCDTINPKSKVAKLSQEDLAHTNSHYILEASSSKGLEPVNQAYLNNSAPISLENPPKSKEGSTLSDISLKKRKRPISSTIKSFKPEEIKEKQDSLFSSPNTDNSNNKNSSDPADKKPTSNNQDTNSTTDTTPITDDSFDTNNNNNSSSMPQPSTDSAEVLDQHSLTDSSTQHEPRVSEASNEDNSSNPQENPTDSSQTSNAILAASVARSVISATRSEFGRNAIFQQSQNNQIFSQQQPSDTNPPAVANFWPPMQENVARVLEDGISSFILDILDSRQPNLAQNTNPLANSTDASFQNDTNSPIDSANTSEVNNSSQNEVNIDNNQTFNSQSNLPLYDNTHEDITSNTSGVGLGYIDVPGGYRFRIFPILSSSSLESEDLPQTTNYTNNINPEPQNSSIPVDLTTENITPLQNSTSGINIVPSISTNSQNPSLASETEFQNINSSSDLNDDLLQNTNTNTVNTDSSDNQNTTLSEQDFSQNQREILRQMLHSQNARNRQVPAIIVGVESRSVNETTSIINHIPNSNSDDTQIQEATDSTQTRSPGRVRSILNSLYDRFTRLIPMSSNNSVNSNDTSRQTRSNSNANDSNPENQESLLPEYTINGFPESQPLEQRPGLTSPSSSASNGFIVYVFATSFRLSHPLLLSFLVSSLFPGLMENNSSSFLNSNSGGQLYEDFMALSDLLGQAISPVASMRDVEDQLPKYIYSTESVDNSINKSFEFKSNKQPESEINISRDIHNDDSCISSCDLIESNAGNHSAETDKINDQPDSNTNLNTCNSKNSNFEVCSNSYNNNNPENGDQKSLDSGIIRVGRLTSDSETVIELLSAEKCLVCMEEFGDGEFLRILKCRHGFHADCLANWITKGANRCPVCRAEAVQTTAT
ncbi:hypothetical protein BB561_004054 [Smittium simulii]|uniref:RING-type domain-containing protein n=1 Tax=Smittium simulii TaxID=133385 RepID=A0A2T9YI97_9FUNG|nr:hypothetical protein BB561_004054 [Smittium simulii]